MSVHQADTAVNNPKVMIYSSLVSDWMAVDGQHRITQLPSPNSPPVPHPPLKPSLPNTK